MSSLFLPHCEWCKILVVESAPRKSREGDEVCYPCYKKEQKQDLEDYEELLKQDDGS